LSPVFTMRPRESTCTTCSVGCRITVDSSRDQILRYQGVDDDPVNWGWMCDRGRFNFEAVGSEDRLDFTVIGPAVNRAARLESLTKEYDCAVVVSRRAADVAGLDVKGRKLHQALVAGRTQTVEFYALKTLADLRV